MVTHIVLLGLAESTTDEDRQAIVHVIDGLRDQIVEIQSLQVYADCGWFADNADIGVVVTVADREAHAAYEAHPAHKEVEGAIAPHVVSRTAVQAVTD
jgi:hypothetical protein